MNELLLADLRENNNVNRYKVRRDWKHRTECGEVERDRRAGTEEGMHARSRSSSFGPSRRDPMPKVFFLATIGGALVWVLAIFGLISIAQFLQHIWGG